MKLKEKISKADPESGYYVKGEREKQFAYSAHTSCATMDLFLAQSSLLEIFMTVKSPFSSSNNRRDFFLKSIVLSLMLGIRHLSLFTFDSFEPSTLFALFKAQRKKAIIKNEFLYDEYFDCYICPQDQMLAFSTVTREGYREYKSIKRMCELSSAKPMYQK